MIQIDEFLKKHKVGITELAEKLDVSRQTVHYYINQGDKNTVVTLNKIAVALGVPVTELFEQPATDEMRCPVCGTSFQIKNPASNE
ncbi:hypothetical protein FACS189451_00640 [Bacteroidia bacterium]|nr:hypothetical protein FACS189451_00640 [Bacteroidia bacterium]